KVLMLVHTFPPFGSVGGSIRLLKYLNFMSRENGWKPTVITIDPSIDLLWVSKHAHHSLEQIPDDVKLILTNTGEFKDLNYSNKGLSALLRKLKLAVLWPIRKFFLIPDDKKLWCHELEKAALQELNSDDYSLIYATAPPFSVLLTATKLKEKTGLPLVFDVKDDWAVPENFTKLKRFRKGIEAKLEHKCVAAADKLIAVTQRSLDDHKARHPNVADKFELIHNGCDISEYKPYWDQPPAKFEKFTLIHTGIFSSKRDLTHLFHALRRLIDEQKNETDTIEFVLIGKVPAAQAKVIRELGLAEAVRNLDYLERDLYVQTLTKAHLPVVINYDVPTLIPGKLYEYWGSRNRMLLLDRREGAAADLVHKYDLGSVVSPDDEDSIYNCIRNAYLAWQDGNLAPVDVSGLAEFDRRFLTGKLEKVFEEVMQYR
ncbi:MAG: glycosyltransferase, partial [Pseudomonadota bacterium]